MKVKLLKKVRNGMGISIVTPIRGDKYYSVSYHGLAILECSDFKDALIEYHKWIRRYVRDYIKSRLSITQILP